jgi:hypothetical protein
VKFVQRYNYFLTYTNKLAKKCKRGIQSAYTASHDKAGEEESGEFNPPEINEEVSGGFNPPTPRATTRRAKKKAADSIRLKLPKKEEAEVGG